MLRINSTNHCAVVVNFDPCDNIELFSFRLLLAGKYGDDTEVLQVFFLRDKKQGFIAVPARGASAYVNSSDFYTALGFLKKTLGTATTEDILSASATLENLLSQGCDLPSLMQYFPDDGTVPDFYSPHVHSFIPSRIAEKDQNDLIDDYLPF